MESPLTKTLKVLDKGHIKLLDWMGDDLRPVEAARTSYGGSLQGDEKDYRLLDYLYKNKHMGPFEFIVLLFEVKCPLATRSQWHRHRTWSYNEFSMRYAAPTVLSDGEQIDFHRRVQWQSQSANNKQKAEGDLDPYVNMDIRAIADNSYDVSEISYQELLEAGAAREQARDILPVGTYTKFWGLVKMRNFLEFLVLRDDEHASADIQAYARAAKELTREQFPRIIELFERERERERKAYELLREYEAQNT